MSKLLEQYCGMRRQEPDGRVYEIRTQQVLIELGVGDRLADLAKPFLGRSDGEVIVVLDDNTHLAAGRQVEQSLTAADRPFRTVKLEPTHGREIVVCDDETLDQLTALIGDTDAVGVVAVGSGTINDLVKMSSHRRKLPAVTVATAPSNNGYTSAIAAILSDGLKTTQPCSPITAVFADPGVVGNAPYRMIASGIGDLYSKPVSNADWRLAARLTGGFYSPVVMEIVEAGNALLEGVAPLLPGRDLVGVSNLTEAIMLSGLAMQAAGSSGPASGGEHLVSHFLDMTAEIDGEPHDFHGCQVAVGTVVTADLYESLAALDPNAIDVDQRVSALLPWPKYVDILRARFGSLSDAVLQHAEKAYPSAEDLRERLELLRGDWDEIIEWVSETLRPSKDLAAELIDAECPTTFDGIGVSRARAERAIVHCKDIRNRYTILHLLWELGLLEELGAKIVAEQFGSEIERTAF